MNASSISWRKDDLNRFFIIFNLENARSQATWVQDSVNKYLYAIYRLLYASECQLYFSIRRKQQIIQPLHISELSEQSG